MSQASSALISLERSLKLKTVDCQRLRGGCSLSLSPSTPAPILLGISRSLAGCASNVKGTSLRSGSFGREGSGTGSFSRPGMEDCADVTPKCPEGLLLHRMI